MHTLFQCHKIMMVGSQTSYVFLSYLCPFCRIVANKWYPFLSCAMLVGNLSCCHCYSLFRYGTVTSIRLIYERWCAFVNFSEEWSAAAALEALQVIFCFGKYILGRVNT